MSEDNTEDNFELGFDPDEEQFPSAYDLEKFFDENIYPMLKTIVNLCDEYHIPMLAAFQYKNDEPGQVMLCTSMVLPQDRACEKMHAAAQYLVKSS
jgi:hypothetical protein